MLIEYTDFVKGQIIKLLQSVLYYLHWDIKIGQYTINISMKSVIFFLFYWKKRVLISTIYFHLHMSDKKDYIDQN